MKLHQRMISGLDFRDHLGYTYDEFEYSFES